MCFSPQRRAIFSTSELQKVLPDPQFFNIFTSTCAFRHSGVQFFDIWTSKSALGMRCFVHFHFQMCFSPQRRAIFSTSELQKVLRGPQFFNMLTSKCAFRHSGVQFLISPLWAATSAPAALTGLLLDWPDTRIIEKTQHFATSLTFGADVSSFFWLFALLHLLSADLTTLLCFSTVHIVGSFYLNFLRL